MRMRLASLGVRGGGVHTSAPQLASVSRCGSQNRLTTVVAKSSIPIVGTVKRKAVINAEASQIERVQPLIDAGRYRTFSEFVREAMDEKLQRIEQERIAAAVEHYCAAGHAGEDIELIDVQAFATERLPHKRRGPRRAKR